MFLDRAEDRRAISLAIVQEYQSEVAARHAAPYPRSARMTIHCLALALLLGMLFMYIARIDRVVHSSMGALVTADPPTVYQALDPSVIRTLDVREGQRVGRGQTLATLNSTFAASLVQQLRAQMEGLEAQVARDKALLADEPLVYPAPLTPQVARFQEENLEAYYRQKSQYVAEMKSFDQKAASLRATIDKYAIDEARFAKEAEANAQIEHMRITLAKHGSGSMLNLLIATQSKIETLREADFSRNSRIEAEHTLASTLADQKSFAEQFKATVSQDLLTVRTTLETTRPQLNAALKREELVRWSAPEDSYVLSVAPGMSAGSVVSQGTTIISLMPVRNTLDALVQVPASEIAFIRTGDFVTLKISAFNASEFGTVEGSVKWVGAAAYTSFNNQTVPAYYNVEVSLERSRLINIPATASLLPGMTLEADIKVGTRSIWDYVVGSLMRGVGESMREP